MSADHVHPGAEERRRGFMSEQIVVSLPYRRLVVAQLEAWDAKPRSPLKNKKDDDSPLLGLTRLQVEPAAAVRHLQSTRPDLLTPVRSRTAPDRDSDLDLLLGCLWEHFRREYTGWVPTFGKNRLVHRPAGSHVIAGGGAGRMEAQYVIAGGNPPKGAAADGLVVALGYVIAGGGQDNAPSTSSADLVARRLLEPGRNVTVGMVDTLIFDHPWLAGGYLAEAEAVCWPYPKDPRGTAQHATFVAGLIARQAPGAVIEIRAALDDEALGDSWQVAKAIAELGRGPAQVINLSLGCTTEDDLPPLVLSRAVASLGSDAIVVAAAGNHAEPGAPVRPAYPAALDDVVAVGALDGDQRATFSPDARWVDAMAPGVDVASTCDVREGGDQAYFGVWSGTSFAAALVAGKIAASLDGSASPQDAWRALAKKSWRDERGRPIIHPTRPEGWPPDAKP